MIYSKDTDKYRDGFEDLLKDLDKGLEAAKKPLTKKKWTDLAGKNYEQLFFKD